MKTVKSSPEDLLLKLFNFHSNTSDNNGKNPNVESKVKEKSYNQKNESDCDYQVIEGQNEDYTKEDLTYKSSVINTISDKNNNCKQISNAKNKLKIKKRKKKSVYKYKNKSKQTRRKERIENAAKTAAKVNEKLKQQLVLLKEKKKPNFKFLCSPLKINAPRICENPTIKYNKNSENVLDTGDSGFVIVDVVGGYKSDQEETNYDINKDQLPGDGTANRSNLSEVDSEPKICEYDKDLMDNEKTSVSNENKLLQPKSIHSNPTSKLKICESIMQSLELEKRDNVGANLEPMSWYDTTSTGNYLRKLSSQVFSKPEVNAIVPTKTKDITKIKGWKNKRFVVSNEEKQPVLSNKSAFVSKRLNQSLSTSPQLYRAANRIQKPSTPDFVNSNTDNFNAPSVSKVTTTGPITSPVFKTAVISTISNPRPIATSDNSIPVLTNSDIPSTSSTLYESLKPYKPNQLLEESRLPISTELMYSMNRKQRRENHGRILNYRKQLVSNHLPFDRKSYKISSDITNTHSYIVYNGKRLKVASSKIHKIIANIKNPKKISKVLRISKSFQIKNVKTEREEPQFVKWETVDVKLPTMSLSVVPQYGRVIHPKIEHLIRNETWHLSENYVKFALSSLRNKNDKSESEIFKFPLSYADNQKTMKVKRRISEEKVIETDDDIRRGVKSVVDKLLDYVDVLDETKYLHTNYENVKNSTDEPLLPVSKVGRSRKSRCGFKSQINKGALELKRLNCQIVSVVNNEDNSDNEKCTKEVCKLGCICKTLKYNSKNLLPIHCGSWKCIFKCSCKNTVNMDDDISLPVGYNAETINRLQNQVQKNLAKVEKEFTQTIIKTNNQLIMVGGSKQRRCKVTKVPEKYSGDFKKKLTDIKNDEHRCSIDDEFLPADIKPCFVSLQNYDLNDIIPYCMIHSMYKCVCMSKSVAPIPSVINHCSKLPSPRKPKLLRKQSEDKTEVCSRTRGLSTSYCILRNTTEYYLDVTLKSSKRLSGDLRRYLCSLRVKRNKLRRTSEFTNPMEFENASTERNLLGQIIDRLSPYLQEEIHLNNLISRQKRRRGGILTRETVRKKHRSNNEDSLVDILSSNNLNAAVNSKSPDPDQSKGQEKYQSSPRRNELRLSPWTSLQNDYNRKALEIWYLNTNEMSPIVITSQNIRPTVNHRNIRVFEHEDEASIPLDFIRCIVRKQVPMNKNPNNIFVILKFCEKSFCELCVVCEKWFDPNNLDCKIQISILQQIKGISLLEFLKEITAKVVQAEEQKREILQSDVHQNKKNLIRYFAREVRPHTLYYDPINVHSGRSISLPLPREVINCKWRIIRIDRPFSYLRLVLNNFAIEYSIIIKVVQLARQKCKTIVLTSDGIQEGYSFESFGIYCVPTYLDKIFVGPYFTDSDHHVNIINTNVDNKMTNGLWINQISNNSAGITVKSQDEDLPFILKKWKCSHLLAILSSSREQNQCATGYQEATYWNDLNSLMKGVDVGKSHNKADSKVVEKYYNSIKNNYTIKYITTNISGLGYIKAFVHKVTKIIDIICPLTNQITQFTDFISAAYEITTMLIKNLVIPSKIYLELELIDKLHFTMKPMANSAVLNGYHLAGTSGVKNIRYSSEEDLKALGHSKSQIKTIINYRTKRQIGDLTNQLARSFSLQSISNRRPPGDVLTEVTKIIISTIKLNTVGSSIINIKKSFEVINMFPAHVKAKIYKQLEQIALNLKKKELSTVQVQKIKINTQEKKFASLILSASTSNTVDKNTKKLTKIRLLPQTENSVQVQKIKMNPQKTESASSKPSASTSNTVDKKTEEVTKIRLLPQTENSVQVQKIKMNPQKTESAGSKPSASTSNTVDKKTEEVTKIRLFPQTENSVTEVIIRNGASAKPGTSQFQRIKILNIEKLPNATIKFKPTKCKEIQPSVPNEKFLFSASRKRSNSSIIDVDTTKPQDDVKRLKTNVQNDYAKLKNEAIQVPFKDSVPKSNVVITRTKSFPRNGLQVVYANENTTSLPKDEYVNLVPFEINGEKKFVILSNIGNGIPLQQNIDVEKQFLVPLSTNATNILRKPVKILPKGQSLLKFPLQKTNTVSVPTTALPDMIPADETQAENLS